MFLEPADVHQHDQQFPGADVPHWRLPETYDPDRSPYRYDFRTCSYCGSIHPSDLKALLEKGARLEPTTEGYKAYVIAPNPVAGQRVRIGSRHAPGEPEEIIYGDAPRDLQQKIYWNHFTAEQRAEMFNVGKG